LTNFKKNKPEKLLKLGLKNNFKGKLESNSKFRR